MFFAPSDSRWSPAPQISKYTAGASTTMLQGFLPLTLITACHVLPQKSKSNGHAFTMISGCENVHFYWNNFNINKPWKGLFSGLQNRGFITKTLG